MPDEFPSGLLTDTNRAVLAHLADKSAHSDVAAALREAMRALGDVQLFCPDWQAYRYVTASTGNVIFGFAAGMGMLGFRLPEPLRSRALATGASPCPDCGPDWVQFTLFRPDWPAVDTAFWALKAYARARES